MEYITANCVNGSIKAGDIVISAPGDEYSCLVGRVLKINPLGSPEHDEETENETDDVHVNFLEFQYAIKRVKEIAAAFTKLYGVKKSFDEYALDDVIMAPDYLIRITGIEAEFMEDLLQSGYFAACYCYGILKKNVTFVMNNKHEDLIKSLSLENQFRPAIHLEWDDINDYASKFLTGLLGRDVIAEGKRADYYYWSIDVSSSPLTQDELGILSTLVKANEHDLEVQSLDEYPITELDQGIAKKLMAKLACFNVATSLADDEGVWLIGDYTDAEILKGNKSGREKKRYA